MYEELVKELRERAAYLDFTRHYGETANPFSNAMKQAADAIEELSKPRWIPVTERPPEDCTPVQVCYSGYYSKEIGSDMLACRYEGTWCYWDGEPCSYDPCRVEITHWMPLPEPPKEGTE